MSEVVTIDAHFCGPPTSGNGGYVCGRLASYIDGPAAVQLRIPPPLDVPLEVRRSAEIVELMAGETLVAKGWSSEVAPEVPKPPSLAEATLAAAHYVGFDEHWFPSCFVCGPERRPGDGLRLFAGSVDGRDCVACPWTPDASLGNDAGDVLPEFVWAALDCPGAFSFPRPDCAGVLLGQLAVALQGRIAVGEPCVVIGWEIGDEGRKHFTGTAVFGESGTLRGVGLATWFEVHEDSM